MMQFPRKKTIKKFYRKINKNNKKNKIFKINH